jgi:hypothetical protein
MRASRAVKLTEKVLETIQRYAFLCQQWELTEEEDYHEFTEELLDVISGTEEE